MKTAKKKLYEIKQKIRHDLPGGFLKLPIIDAIDDLEKELDKFDTKNNQPVSDEEVKVAIWDELKKEGKEFGENYIDDYGVYTPIIRAFRSVSIAMQKQEGGSFFEAKQKYTTERNQAIIVLRQICEKFGDNDWDENLHLFDIIDKHLGRYLLPPLLSEKDVTDEAFELSNKISRLHKQLPDCNLKKHLDLWFSLSEKKEGKEEAEVSKELKCNDCGVSNESVQYRGAFNGIQCYTCKKNQDIEDEECR